MSPARQTILCPHKGRLVGAGLTHFGRVQMPLFVWTEHWNVGRIGLAVVRDLTKGVCPAVQFDVARLPIEREVGQIESAQRFRCSRNPVQHWTVRIDNCSVFAGIEHVFAVDAVDTREKGTHENNVWTHLQSCFECCSISPVHKIIAIKSRENPFRPFTLLLCRKC